LPDEPECNWKMEVGFSVMGKMGMGRTAMGRAGWMWRLGGTDERNG
jgi:hypothetical protein